MLVRREIVQVADGFTFRGSATHQPRARRPKALSTSLTDSVAGQSTVEGLIASTLLGRPKDSVLFHAGD
jgi:hypothetical protein